MSVSEFNQCSDVYLKEIKQDLESRRWTPKPYLQIIIPKKGNEHRSLGLLTVKDKVVQQAIKLVIEPIFEQMFVSNSYGYRQGKGHRDAIKFTEVCFRNRKMKYALRLDIDNFFDTINHQILFDNLAEVIDDEEVLRLIQLCIKMGVVNKRLEWSEPAVGIPQGAILSPLLANFYLHPFDRHVLQYTNAYVRYADDFLILSENIENVQKVLDECRSFLQNNLKLRLNKPAITTTEEGTEFLGIVISKLETSVSSDKFRQLVSRINLLDWDGRSFCEDGVEAIRGILKYYQQLLPQSVLIELDKELICRIKEICERDVMDIPNRSTLFKALKEIVFLAKDSKSRISQIRSEIINHYLSFCPKNKTNIEEVNRKLILSRKREYRKRENETTELVVNSYGSFIGVNNKGLSLKVSSKKRKLSATSNIKHITVLSDGVSISSNALNYCMQKGIGVDYFTKTGKHIGSFLSDSYVQTSLWQNQVAMSTDKKSRLAVCIISGKVRNQVNLIKYFHKYHKNVSPTLNERFNEIIPKIKIILAEMRNLLGKEDYISGLTNMEAKCAEYYWSYIRELLKDDLVGFERRERKGATDLVNMLLNYGYAILYPRIWRSLLKHRLNTSCSVIHIPRKGKPTFVYDVIEIFRAQSVDRVVISLIQKREPMNLQNSMLDNNTRNLLVGNVLERINRYEKYRGKECRLCDIIDYQVKEIAEFIEKGTTYRPYIAKW